MTHVLGVDGCRNGWCAVSLQHSGDDMTVAHPAIFGSFSDVLAWGAEVIAVDIPIGLTDGPVRRECDAIARARLGPKWPAVFDPPCRAALSRSSYAAANAMNRRTASRGLTIQAYGITPKTREVDEIMSADPMLQKRVREVHPELCFWALNGGAPVLSKKKRVAGREERWALLRAVLPSLPPEPPRPRDLPRGCAPDDYIDALVAAWTALCISRDEAIRIPPEPPRDPSGLRMEMWHPPVR